MSKIFLEIFDKKREEVFRNLSAFKNFGYLAGGTALALQIKHRKSVDFDIFVRKAISNYLRLKSKRLFDALHFYVNTSDQLSFHTKDEIGVTFVWYYYKPLYPLVKTSSLSLASVRDIVADKAFTIGRRATWRDYVDLFFLLKERVLNLPKVIRLAERKFRGEFNEALFLQQLVYFKDLNVSQIDFLERAPSSSEIQKFLEEEVRRYVAEGLVRERS